jgi:hypothetical protein
MSTQQEVERSIVERTLAGKLTPVPSAEAHQLFADTETRFAHCKGGDLDLGAL